MHIVVQPTPEAAAHLAAQAVIDRVRAHPASILGLATGHTMVPFYRELVRMHREQQVSFRGVSAFALDEYRGVAAADFASCRGFLDRHLLRLLDVDARRIRLLNGLTEDPLAECARYEQAITEAGGIDLQLLGIGRNGHIGFNEPGSPLDSRTRVTPLTASTRQANAAAWSGDVAVVPLEALTMGIGTILEAHACLLLAFGASKARAVAAAVNGPVTTSLPASALRRHADVQLVLDAGAASLLDGRASGGG